MLIRLFLRYEERVRSAWGTRAATPAILLRLGIAGATFLAVCVGMSPVELRRAQLMARDLENPTPARNIAEEFYSIPVGEFGAPLREVDGSSDETDAGSYSEFPRIAVVGSSESENWYQRDFPSEFPNLSAAMSATISERFGQRLPVIRAYCPWRQQILRIQNLVRLSRSEFEIDLIVVSLPIHGFAGKGVRLRDQSDTLSITSMLRILFGRSPIAQVDQLLAGAFFAYEGRFQYTLGPHVPGASAPIVIRFQNGDRDDGAATGLAVDSIGEPDKIEDVPRQIAQIVRENARTGNVEQLLIHANRCAEEFDVQIVLVLMPLGAHLFTPSDRAELQAYGDALANQLRAGITSDSVRILDLRNSGIVAPDQFRDPVHLLDFASVSEAIVADLTEVAWL